jgi:signal transduction histidine kinase
MTALDGTVRELSFTAAPIRDGAGQIRGAVVVARDVAARRLAEAERAQLTAELQRLSRRLLQVQEAERRWLARELHDEIGQVLTGLNFQLAGAAGTNGDTLAEAQATVQALTEQVRQLSMDLRPAVLDRFGLLAAVEWHLARYQQRTGIAVDLRHHGLARRFAPDLEIGAFRVVQEALTNVARHARVDRAAVQLFADDGALTVVVRDDGCGFDATQPPTASGLGGMRERVELLGGMLTIEATPGAGTAITAELPLDRPADQTTDDGPAPEARP